MLLDKLFYVVYHAFVRSAGVPATFHFFFSLKNYSLVECSGRNSSANSVGILHFIRPDKLEIALALRTS